MPDLHPFHPEEFRIAIQTVIQTLRTVTFILQSNKENIPEFEEWYSSWQGRLKNDPLMRWMVDARNKIEKEGDLEVHSFVRAEVFASYLSEEVPSIEVPAHLFDDTPTILHNLPRGDLGDHIVKHGALRVQRRWVENTLPNYELLDATAIAYGRIAEIVCDAHHQIGINRPETTNLKTGQKIGVGSREGRMPCMIGHSEARSVNVRLSDGCLLSLELVQERAEKADAEAIVERYGGIPPDMFGPPNANEEEITTGLFSVARKMFETDGYHRTIFFLISNKKVVDCFEARLESQAEKYLLMRTVAHNVTRHGADAVIELGEVWLAPANSLEPFQRPAESPQREEALVATLVRKHGTPITLFSQICRGDEQVALGETQIHRDEAPFMFSPVYEAWGRSIPTEWKSLVEEATKHWKASET